jgi:hypothetical protein
MQQHNSISIVRQMRVILRSYLTLPALRWTMLLLLVGVGLGYSLHGLMTFMLREHRKAFAWSDTMLLANLFTFLLVLGGVAGVLIVFFAHARGQLMGPIARLMPQGRRANLYVAGGLLIVLAGFFSLLPPSGDTHSYFGGFLLILSLFTLIALAVCRPMLIPLPIAFVVLACTPFGQILDHIERSTPPYQIYTPGYVAQMSELRIIVVLGNILALICIAEVAKPSASQPERLKKNRAPFTPPSTNRVTLPARQHHFIQSDFSRTLHRRFAAHDWRAAGVTAIAMVILTAAFAMTSSSASAGSMLTGMLAFLPGGLVAIAWRERWSNFDYESLYPVTRRQFINDNAAGLLLEVAEFWIATTSATLLTLLCFRADALREPRFWAALLAGAMMQGLWIGAIFFIGQRRQTTTYLVGLAPLVMAMFLTLENHWRSFEPVRPMTTVIAALAQMLVGLVLFLMTWAYLLREPRASNSSTVQPAI